MTEKGNEMVKGANVTELGRTFSRSAELSDASEASRVAAEVQAKFIMAERKPRNYMDIRARLLQACERRAFAMAGIYSKPIGNTKIRGLSIRFAEEAAKNYGNMGVRMETLRDDDMSVKVRISVTDFETNYTTEQECNIEKTIERRNVRAGQEVIGERENTKGEKVYIIKATADDIANKTMNQAAKARRNCILQHIPADLLEEAKDTMDKAQRSDISSDLPGQIKKICDSFMRIGVRPAALTKYLGHDINATSPVEVQHLREVYTAISSGEATWADFDEDATIADAASPKSKADSLKSRLETHKAANSVDDVEEEEAPESAKKKERSTKKAQSKKPEPAVEPEPVSDIEQGAIADAISTINDMCFELIEPLSCNSVEDVLDSCGLPSLKEVKGMSEEELREVMKVLKVKLAKVKLAKEREE